VAAHLGAFKFRDCGPALNSGVTDSGIAYLQGDGRKIAIDTFPDKTSRDDWLPTGQPPSKGFPTGVVVVLVLLAAILAALVTAARKLRIVRFTPVTCGLALRICANARKLDATARLRAVITTLLGGRLPIPRQRARAR
jgi:hypothetical protein